MEELIPLGSRGYFLLLSLLAASRGLDFFSTWLATPRLVLEANPVARWLGWKWGAAVNGIVCATVACWPLLAIVLITTSALVAARNFQLAWLMRSMGEHQYRSWMAERLSASRRGVFVFCTLAQTLLLGAVGSALVFFSHMNLVPFAVGVGILTYGTAISVFSLLAVRRLWREMS